MRIINSDTTFSSVSLSASKHETHERLHAWDGNSELNYSADSMDQSAGVRLFNTRDIVELMPQQTVDKQIPDVEANSPAANKRKLLSDEFLGSLRETLIKRIVEMMTGKEIKVYDPQSSDSGTGELPAIPAENAPSTPAASPDGPQRQGWGIDYQYSDITSTTEGFLFSAQGSVTTADGRSINFAAELQMTRQTYEEINVSLKAGDALIDPLVMNLSAQGTSLGDATFAFDLNADGTMETIHAPAAGSGFLAIDRNGNGVIDDGSELFGPSTGSGFDELAALDEDGNGWIDESDSAFGKLRIWQIASSDSQSLTSLLDSNVGAIATGRAATAYTLTDGSNGLAGAIRETGMYLKENGGAGTIQEIDIAV